MLSLNAKWVVHAFLAFWQNVDVSKFSSAVPCLFSETSAFSEKRRFSRVSVNFRFWHRTDQRFERIAAVQFRLSRKNECLLWLLCRHSIYRELSKLSLVGWRNSVCHYIQLLHSQVASMDWSRCFTIEILYLELVCRNWFAKIITLILIATIQRKKQLFVSNFHTFSNCF